MINDKFQPIHLQQRRITSPLFQHVREAHSSSSDSKKQVNKYMVIESSKTIPEQIFYNAPICPVFVYSNRSYIYMEGECLWNYFLARKHKDIVLTQEELWTLIGQLCKALTVLRAEGKEHRHIKEYAIRRVNADTFKIIYHPDMNRPYDLISENKGRWYQFYYAPQQLGDFLKEESNSCVFSIGAMVLNIMNPMDFKRDIYSLNKYEVNEKIVNQKIKNAASGFYSNKLIDAVANMLVLDHKKRISLEELAAYVAKNDPIAKKKQESENWKQLVSSRLSKSKQKKAKEEIARVINFQRGTFGGQSNNGQEEVSEWKENEDTKVQGIKTSKQQMKYNQYHEQFKKDTIKPKKTIQKSQSQPSASVLDTSFIEEQQDTLMIEMSKLSIFQQNKEKDVIKYEIDEFNMRVCEYHIKLSECLQPIEDLIQQIGHDGVWIDGDIFYGTLLNGRRNGIGLQLFPNRQYYYGYFKDDIFHGQGFYFWNNSQYFLGVFETGNKKEGTWQGRGKKYVGQIRQNKRHGIGTCYYPTGKVYEGQWYQGRYQGTGIITEPSGERFIGLFRDGKKWGKGYFLAQNCRITGIWDGDEAIGSVQIIYQNGNTYKGMINNQFEKNGEGLYRFKTGVICQGMFKEDEFVFGEIRYRNGEKYFGDVKDFRRHGKGKYYYTNGNVAEGMWINGTQAS